MELLKIYLTAILLTVCTLFNAQNNFSKIFTNNGFDYGEGINQATDSSYFITGSSSSFEEGPSQAFILHVDTGGNYLWSKSYGGVESDIGKRIFHVKNDGIYVFGHSNSFSNGYFDFYLIKTNEHGELLWQKNYGGESNELLFDAIILPDTTFILVGQTTSNETEIEDIIYFKINKNGDKIWEQIAGGEGQDIGKSISMIDPSNIIIGGEYFDLDSNKTKGLLMSIDQHGNLNWQKQFGTNGTYSFYDIDADFNLIRAVGYHIDENSTIKQYLTFKCNINGLNPIETTTYQSGNNYMSNIVTHGSFKNEYIAMQPTDNSVIPTYSGGEDLLICRYKNDLSWATKCVNPSNHGNDHCNQLIATNDLGAISVGYNTFKGKGGANLTLLKIGPYDQFPDTSIDPIEESLVETFKLTLDSTIKSFPNPCNDILTIQVNSNQTYNYTLNSICGETIESNSFNREYYIFTKNYKPGIYILNIFNNNSFRTIKLIINH